MLKKIRCNFDLLLELLVVSLFVVSLLPRNISNKEISNIVNSKLNTNFSYHYEEVSEDEVIQEESKEEEISVEIKEEKDVKGSSEKTVEEIKEEETASLVPSDEVPSYSVIETYYGTLTGYGPDCKGCSGLTASGYNVKDTITYHDEEFGELRIVAADKSIPFYSIIRISDIRNSEPIYAIVLDTGGNVGFSKFSTFDLLFSSEVEASKQIGTLSNIKFELIRKGA